MRGVIGSLCRTNSYVKVVYKDFGDPLLACVLASGISCTVTALSQGNS